ncbi:alpha-glucosidase [Furfurilactobacillus rossiae]|uniref:glycoside hydrolase family 31 protein n=1 Tax=Furfurilactobacillus rossiae TaxID=231049 RepID=UPI0015C1035B|nr:glycoside hydrolase family 31 protein [Furfurilactobacillus rossiae]MCF6165221.1 glycoside hydrolase family 31 protein [Furfurilactobacillus rossiae]QLE65300.1 alpha-glucosidase [Furfurilactobacillus rossiae]
MANTKLTFSNENQIINIKNATESLQLSILTDSIIRVFENHKKATNSYAIEGNKFKPTDYSVEQNGNHLEITTTNLKLKVYKNLMLDVYDANDQPLIMDYRGTRQPIDKHIDEAHKKIVRAEGHEVSAVNSAEDSYYEIVKTLADDEQFYGLGDKTGYLNKRGYEYDNWNMDEPRPHIETFTHLYKSIPALFGLKNGHPYGMFFDNTYRSHFDLGKENQGYYFYSAVDGNIDYYVLGGKTLKDVISNYTYLTGTTPLPQRWMLGYQQSRWGYSMSQAKVEEIVDKFEEYDLPLEAVHFDIDYMDGYRVFTWDKNKYKNPKKLLSDLRKRGVRVIPILDPGVKQDDNYNIYQEGVKNGYFAKGTDGSIYINRVWPGKSAFPDFGNPDVRQWWAKHCKFLLDNGAAGIWTDMNEPATFDGDMPEDVVMTDEDKPSSLKRMNNVYGHNMAKATFEGIKNETGKRPYVITRAAYSGTQKYSTIWTGDNQSIWSHLQMMIPQMSNLGLSGFSFAGTDIGGFSADTTPELLTRWIEGAIFSPLLRNHCVLQVRDQEPWVFGDKVLNIYRKFLRLRYHFIPYLYDCFSLEAKNGLPVFRPLVLNYPGDPKVRNLNDEYMVGNQVLVAPIVQQGQTNRSVYLPEGSWIDLFTGVQYTGNTNILANAQLDQLPVFIKTGSILPWGKAVNHLEDAPADEMTFRLFGARGSYVHYQDNGEDFKYQDGEYNLYNIKVSDNGHCCIELTKHGYKPIYRTIHVEANGKNLLFTYDDTTKTYVTK